MTLEEIKKLDNSFWLDFLRAKSVFDVDRIEDMLNSLLTMADELENLQGKEIAVFKLDEHKMIGE